MPAPNFSPPVRVSLIRWDELALDKVTEMIARKVISGVHSTLAQVYLKKGALVPWHAHEGEQLTYVLEGALRVVVGGDETTVREGEVLHVPGWAPHQAEAIDDTFVIAVYSPGRADWLHAPEVPQEAP